MNFEEFEKLYNDRKQTFDLLLGSAKSKLIAGLETIRADSGSRRLRVRYIDGRVKDCMSLYSKATRDGLDISTALSTNNMRDLLGLRIVCHNLTDVRYLSRLVLHGGDSFDFNVSMRHGDIKDWVETAQPESGYRGWHCDIVFRSLGTVETEYAELQIRTVLQDSWATFMHDDLHKADLTLLADEPARNQLRLSSDLLHSLDGMADQLRSKLEAMRVLGSAVYSVDAVDNAMFSMATFRPNFKSIRPYVEMKRVDSYTVSRGEAEFQFEICGTLIQKHSFIHIIGGDTPSNNFKLVTVEWRRHPNSNWETIALNDPKLHQDRHPRLVYVSHDVKQIHHNYRITCTWQDVFDRPTEYVWCPWGSLYPSAKGELTLRLSAPNQEIKEDPLVLDLDEFSDLEIMRERFRTRRGQAMLRTGNTWNWTTRNPHGTPVCIFEMV